MKELNDRHQIFNPYSALCAKCKNGLDVITFSCKAFPKGIPDKIMTGKNKHLKPLPGQKNSIVFEPIK